jgi:hypothetical protein
MKGIVFTEFLEFVGRKYGVETMDFMIESSDLPSSGVYTAAGTYDHRELITLVETLSTAIGVAEAELFRTYGQHLLARFSVRYPQFFEGVANCFEFFDHIETHVHAEVEKLYPDAELPAIDVVWRTEDKIQFVYISARPFAALAEGLMRGAIAHFGEAIAVREMDAAEDGTFVRFELTRL